MSRGLYTLLIAAVAGERLLELALSHRHARQARAAGGRETGRGHYPWMVGIHTTFLASCLAEVWILRPPLHPLLAAGATLVLGLTMGLRYWAVVSLGSAWNTRIIVIPGRPPVTGGPYRHLRHPNYVAVTLEMIALPLVHSAWRTALLFSVLNALVLRVRIRAEEAALGELPGGSDLAGRPRFVPLGSRRPE